jgi:uncharacterized protein (DUF934 family)
MSGLIRFTPQGPVLAEKDGRVFTRFADWLAAPAEARGGAVVLAPTDDPAALDEHLSSLSAIAIEFPKPTDGRGFSIATLLRTRLGWTGELRAVGAVAYDQLAFMARCGFDVFDLREEEDGTACLRAFSEIGVVYQGAVDQKLPLFRRRTQALAAIAERDA